ncbi:putative ATP synthase protein YMF19 [Lolium perenne]|uniref:putative ATP synthase protein YMF19 n=1 Tax=Lolium perenne TaxID=4522 RepID=UPI0021F5E5A6|nr:putative ATP synthase protein YMF19 [Lolium perenne]
MPQLDKLTYFSQFFWLRILLFTFYILLFNNNNGILRISRILKLRNQLLSHRGNKIQSKDPKNLEDISRKGFSTGLSYMYSSLSEVSQWCKTVDYLGKRNKITLISPLAAPVPFAAWWCPLSCGLPSLCGHGCP